MRGARNNYIQQIILLNDSSIICSNTSDVNKQLNSSVAVPNPPKSFKVKITASELNYRQGPGMNYKVNGTVKKGEVFTIVETFMNGTTEWGKLKSGAGWISLQYTQRI